MLDDLVQVFVFQAFGFFEIVGEFEIFLAFFLQVGVSFFFVEEIEHHPFGDAVNKGADGVIAGDFVVFNGREKGNKYFLDQVPVAVFAFDAQPKIEQEAGIELFDEVVLGSAVFLF